MNTAAAIAVIAIAVLAIAWCVLAASGRANADQEEK